MKVEPGMTGLELPPLIDYTLVDSAAQPPTRLSLRASLPPEYVLGDFFETVAEVEAELEAIGES